MGSLFSNRKYVFLKNIILFGVFGIVIGAILSPFLGEATKDLILKFQLFGAREPRIEICAPLKSARGIGRIGDKILFDTSIPYPNSTSIIFQNTKAYNLKQFKMLIHPISSNNEIPEIISSQIYTTSLIMANDVDVQTSDSSYFIQSQNLDRNEWVIAYILFHEPVGYLVEVKSDDDSWSFAVSAGCPNASDSFSISRPMEIYSHQNQKYCNEEKECEVKSNDISFEITEEMLEGEFQVENIVISD